MRCLNVAVVEGSEILGRKCQGFLEIALEEAEQARASLVVETVHLRKLLLSTVNEVQSILHQAQILLPDNESLETVRHSHLLKRKQYTDIDPLAYPIHANDTLPSIPSYSCER